MHDRIPIPTDNIFKFYAMFGLLLVVFSLWATIYTNSAKNAVIVEALPRREELQAIENPSRVQKLEIALLDRRMEIAKSDGRFYIWACAVIFFIGAAMMYYGFRRWHKRVQPLQDEMMRTQLAIAKLELEKLRRDISVGPRSVPATEK